MSSSVFPAVPFPLPTVGLPPRVSSKNRRCRQRGARALSATRLANTCVQSLNTLAGHFRPPVVRPSSSLTGHHKSTWDHLLKSSKRYVDCLGNQLPMSDDESVFVFQTPEHSCQHQSVSSSPSTYSHSSLFKYFLRGSGNSFLFSFSLPELRRLFREACTAVGCRTKFTLHSLRHGGATHLHLSGVPIEDVMYRGRWASNKSCRRYIQAGRALLLQMKEASPVLFLASYFSVRLVHTFEMYFRALREGGT